MISQDPRNVTDEFKGLAETDIVSILDTRGVQLHIAIENLERDFNMGSIVRTANAFGVRHVHVIGRRQWNKRGAMATDKYLHVEYHASVDNFLQRVKKEGRQVIVVDNLEGARDIHTAELPIKSVLVFGSEKSGVSSQMAEAGDAMVAIRQMGSTRSLNVAAAAAIAMYEWVRQHCY
jgi:tRNA G18 (ribose-2'-O)-methylase SpoU